MKPVKEPKMTLWFKRAKCFVQPGEADHGTKKYTTLPDNTPRSDVPMWVAETTTFKHGIKDGSIVNLTPPHLMPGYVVPAPVEDTLPVSDGDDSGNDNAAEESADGEEAEVQEDAKPTFGGQPMTPNQRGPRIGGIKANTTKRA